MSHMWLVAKEGDWYQPTAPVENASEDTTPEVRLDEGTKGVSLKKTVPRRDTSTMEGKVLLHLDGME